MLGFSFKNTSISIILGGGVPDVTAPVIDEFSVGSPTGTDYPTTLNFTEVNLPVTVYLVIDLTAAGAPSADQIKLGHGADDLAAAYSTNYTRSTDGEEVVDYGSLADGAYTVYAVLTDPSGNTSTVSSDTFTIAASFGVTLLAAQTSSANATTHTYTIDTSGAAIGDILVVTSGTNSDRLSATYDGNTMSSLYSASSGISGRSQFGYKYTLTGTGGASKDVVISYNSAGNRDNFNAFWITGGDVVTQSTTSGRAASLTASVTPTDTTNVVIGVAHYEDGTTGIDWTGPTESSQAVETVNYTTASSIASASDLPLASYDVTSAPADAASTHDGSVTAILVEPT